MVEGLLEKEVEKKVDRFRLEDEVGIQFENTKELNRALDFLDNEKLPYELYGYGAVGVYKTVREYLVIKGFKISDYEIVDTRYLPEDELRQVRLEQAEKREKSETNFEQSIRKYS